MNAPAQPRPRRPRAPRASSSPERNTIGREHSGGALSAASPTEAADDGPLGTRSVSMASEPSEEDIRNRAYQRFLERGGGHGMDFEDWLEAERELKGSR